MTETVATPAPKVDESRLWMLVGALALLVARPMLASEGVAWLGDDLPFDILWMILAALFFALGLVRRDLRFRFGAIDGLVLLLVALNATSCLITRNYGLRLSLNMLWSWVALAPMFVLLRQLIDTPYKARLVVAVMLALAVVLSCYGVYQVFVGFPNDRDEYRANPDRMLREAGHWYPPGSVERQLFESRLNSDEPIATFALTNSLAGYLAPWLVVAIALVVGRQNRKQRFMSPTALGPLAVSIPVAACLVLTHSRSAYIATAAGLAVLLLGCWQTDPRRKRFLAVATGAVLITVLVFVLAGGRGALAQEARRSLGYRFEYWIATLRMIGDQPFWGVGPGHFQDFYTRYKLPAASEEVRDPHNFLLESAATAGVPAAIVLTTILILFALKLAHAEPLPQTDEAASLASEPGTKRLLAGAAGGLGLAYLVGPAIGLGITFELLVVAILIGTAAVLALYRWIRVGSLSAWMFGLAAFVLLTHLLAAGGLSYPAVSITLWIALALGSNLAEQFTWNSLAVATAKLVFAAGLLASLAGIALCYWSSYVPVLRSYAAMTEALLATERDNFKDRVASLEAAARFDPASPEPWEYLADLHLRRFLTTNYQSALREFRAAQAEYVKRRPHSSAAWRQSGRWLHQVHQSTRHVNDNAQAVQTYRRAVELYPTSAVLRAELASALAAGPQRALAADQAAQALRLDAQTPHADKKLPGEMRREMQDLVSPR